MAETIGVVSGLAGLAGLSVIALKASIALHDTINSYQSHPQRVRDLAEETKALAGVLGILKDTIESTSDVALSALDIPLRRCAKACNEFEQEIKKCSSRSGGDRASFRDWVRLRYMGDDIDSFRRTLASYKVTISIALTDASLRRSSATAENIEGYASLLKTARADLEDRLETIIGKLDDIEQRVTGPTLEAYEFQQIKEEKLSTEKSLQICAQLSAQINQIQLAASSSSLSNAGSDSSSISVRITQEGLEDYKNSISRMTNKLRLHERDLFNRLAQAISASATSPVDAEAIAGLREEWESTRESIDILSTAGSYVGQTTSVIENKALGDAFQIMISANGKVLHGSNRALGGRSRQVGGYMDGETLRQLSQDMLSSLAPINNDVQHQERTQDVPTAEPESQRQTEFIEQYKKGFKVAELGTSRQPDAQNLTNDAKDTAAIYGQALESDDPLPDQEIPDRRDAEAKHAFQAALVKSQETELESLLNDQFDQISQGEFQWLSDLRDTGMGSKDIARILLQAFDGSPWVTVPQWVRAVLSESGQDSARQVPVGFHQASCAHKLCTTEVQGLPTFGSLAFDNKNDTTVEKVAWLSGLAGALPPALEPPTHNGISIVAFSKSAADIIHELQSIVVAQEGAAFCLRAIRRIQACAIELQNNGLCCDRYTILALPLNNEDPEALISTAAMRTITFESLNELATALAQFAESGEDKDHAHIRTRCHSLLSGVFACGGDEFDFTPNELHAFALVVQLLSLSLVLYCRSYVGEFYPPFLKEPLSRITLRGCSNEGPYIVAQPYRLACMAPMLQDDVFAFSFHRSFANRTRSLRPGLYITGTCESIVDTWGPASVVAEIGSPVGEKLHGLRIGGGIIAPSDNGLFHWTSNLSFTPDTRSFSYWEPITVGAPSINNACLLDEEESHRLSAPCLTTCGTEASQWIADERQMLIQGGQYIQLSVGNIYHKVPQKTLKALLLDTWATLQDVRIFNYFFGVQVSLCTGVARRVPLRALIEDPLLHFVDTLRIEGWTALKPSARKAFAGEIDYDGWICSLTDKQHKCIREVCGKLLELLKNTGFDRKGMMRVLWPSKTNPYLCAKAIPEKAQVWCRILRDSEWCATFVVATSQCLETVNQTCQKKRAVPWHGGGTIFATAVCPNFSIAAVPRWMPLGNWGLEDGGSYWIGQPGADTWVSVRKPNTGSAELFVRQNLFPRSVTRWIWQDRVLRERSDSSFEAEDVFVQYIPRTEREMV